MQFRSGSLADIRFAKILRDCCPVALVRHGDPCQNARFTSRSAYGALRTLRSGAIVVRRRYHPVLTSPARTIRRTEKVRTRRTDQSAFPPRRLVRTDRKSLLLGTALASTLLLGSLSTPTPASAAVTCPPVGFPPPSPILIVNPGDDIVCNNVYDRYSNGGTVIGLATNGANEYIALDNSGDLAITSAFGALGIFAYTAGGNSPIDIVNSGDITVSSDIIAFGIRARTYAANSPILIVNSGDIAATGNTIALTAFSQTLLTMAAPLRLRIAETSV